MTASKTSAAVLAFAVLAAIAVSSGLLITRGRALDAATLPAVEAQVREKYPSVAQMQPDRLTAMIAGKEPVLLLDVREGAEYAVSRLPGAIRIAPASNASQFQSAFGEAAAGKTVVVYCSVGMRSSRLAERIASVAKSAGATAVYNLEGGIFRWHNEQRPLERGSSATDEIHPYDRVWQQYVERQPRVTFSPGQSPTAR